MASGLGSPIGGALATALCSLPSNNTVTVTNPGKQTTVVGGAVSLQIKATDSGGLSLTYTSTGLPKGLKLNGSSGLITGKAKTVGKSSVTVTATDSTGAKGSATF
jgi:Putative Ig domain